MKISIDKIEFYKNYLTIFSNHFFNMKIIEPSFYTFQFADLEVANINNKLKNINKHLTYYFKKKKDIMAEK